MTKGIDIYSALSDSRGLSQLVKQVNEITVVVYVYYDAVWCAVLRDYLTENEKDISCVKRVIVLGIPSEEKELRESVIHVTFPNAKIVFYTKAWNEIDPHDIYIDTPLVLHFATSLGNIANDFLNHCEESAPMRRLIEQTRLLYAAVILGTEKIPYVTIYSQLDTFKFADYVDYFAPSSYCLSKERYIRQCQKELTPQSALIACLEEAKHGCEECCMVAKYGKTKVCPLAQHEVALMYRGDDNPSAQSLSHQLERLTAYQGYIPSQIQIADNMTEGCGCEKDIFAALSIYKRYAHNGNTTCCDRIIELAGKEESISNLVALPWIIRLANDGDLDKASELATIFEEGKYGVPIDHSYSRKWQTMLAESGDDKYIAELMRQAQDRQDWKEAIKWSRKLRDLDSEYFDKETYEDTKLKYIHSLASTPYSLYTRGKAFLTSSTEGKDVELAELCLIASAETGYLAAQEFLCEEYCTGQLPRDFKKSIYWGDKALEQGSKDVRFRVAWLRCGEGGVTPDYEISHRFYKELAKEGNSAAMCNLGWMCENGYFFTVNHKKAVEWYLKSAEADFKKSIYWGDKALEQGSKDVRFRVAWLRCGEGGVTPDYEISHRFYKELAKEGNSAAMCNLGWMCENGYFFTVNHKKAVEWYLKSAEAGSTVGARNLAYMYKDGRGTDRNYEEAFRWFLIAAKKEDKSAIKQVIECYRQGLGVEQDNAKVIEWYKKLIDTGDKDAIISLGCFYEGSMDDSESAIKYYRMAAEQDNSLGQYYLAEKYEHGEGVGEDINTAIYWYRKSAMNGDEDAKKKLQSLGVDWLKNKDE